MILVKASFEDSAMHGRYNSAMHHNMKHHLRPAWAGARLVIPWQGGNGHVWDMSKCTRMPSLLLRGHRVIIPDIESLSSTWLTASEEEMHDIVVGGIRFLRRRLGRNVAVGASGPK